MAKKKGSYQKPTRVDRPDIPEYTRSYHEFGKRVKAGDAVVFKRRILDEEYKWVLVEISGVVRDKNMNCVILSNNPIGIPFFVIHDWEIKNESE